jgi:hypothetical protein
MSNNGYKFDQFTEFKSKFSVKISIGKNGGFNFSSGFYHKYNLKNSVGLKLFYDTERKAIAFKFLKNPDSGMITLKKRDAGGHLLVRSFLGKYSIDPKKYAGRYDPQEIIDERGEKIYVIELRERTPKS